MFPLIIHIDGLYMYSKKFRYIHLLKCMKRHLYNNINLKKAQLFFSISLYDVKQILFKTLTISYFL